MQISIREPNGWHGTRVGAREVESYGSSPNSMHDSGWWEGEVSAAVVDGEFLVFGLPADL
jgi:hypothetical protein